MTSHGQDSARNTTATLPMASPIKAQSSKSCDGRGTAENEDDDVVKVAFAAGALLLPAER